MAAIAVPAKCGEIYVPVLMDEEDAQCLSERRLSIGSHGYAQVWHNNMQVLCHRWILGLRTGDGLIGDHINRNVLDCRRENLRIVTPSGSNLNRVVKQRDLPIGVYRTRTGRYQAKVKRHRIQHHLGTFDTPEEAAAAVEAARQIVDRDAFTAPPPMAA
jgi:hypothetical protein